MKITMRLIVSLLIVATVVASLFTYLQFREERKRLGDELDRRATVLAISMLDPVRDLVISGSSSKLGKYVEKLGSRERLVGVEILDAYGKTVARTPQMSPGIKAGKAEIDKVTVEKESTSTIAIIDGRTLHLELSPLLDEGRHVGTLVLYNDAGYIKARLADIWRNNFLRLLTLSLLLVLTTMLVVRWSITGPIAVIAEWLKKLRMGQTALSIELPRGDILGPLAEEVRHLAKNLAVARASAEAEARLRISAEAVWTAERLKEFIRHELDGKNLYVVSNREPYMHARQGRKVECIMPAGGLVTALDPIMRACGGVWIAHGSGDADVEFSDKAGKLRVPPEEPAYTLKRVWITKEEEEGYYYGFSNEGIWPLCHITHTRPIFRLDDWVAYQKVNERFAEAVLGEIADEKEPLVLVQDYHFSLLPLLIKSRRPDAKVAIFWHIPWPNPEAFGICPWKKEMLLGLLGADLIGFHIQYHCNNFLETVDRFMESKINWDEFSVERRGQVCQVKPFPISVAFQEGGGKKEGNEGRNLREAILKEIGVTAKYIGVGVDRIDYTKGIVERFRAVERLIEKKPELAGQFTFVELGAPSRTHIKRYHDLMAEIEETADKINWRFQTKSWKPIVFLKAHHNHETINRYYRAADVCLVTSLHDGMNLVAKEFVASRDDDDGVLVLSQFAGASREMMDAIIVNPYDIEQMADSIYDAITMPREERARRMITMRQTIRERNVFRWAANLVTSLVRVRKPEELREAKAEE
jgi:trehalose-6-phosphate synthase